MSTELAETTNKKNAVSMMADRLSISQPKLMEVLKATVFKACKDDNQFAALIIVANEYQLNPLTKEIYAFPGKGGEIVPIVSIDGWLRIINSHPQFDGMDEDFAEDGSWCKVTIYRKDRSRPTVHTEFFEEVKRSTEPWKQHPRRMLKWKTIIQCGRIAFGFGGIYDEDEGKDVAEMRDVTPRASMVVVRETPIDPTSDPADETPADEQPSEVIDPAPATIPATGRQKKDRHCRDGYLQSVTPKMTQGGKTFWVVNVNIKGKSVDFLTWSESLANDLLLVDEDAAVSITFTVGTKGDFQLEDYTLKTESE